jgi:hypothetical protein
MALNKDDNSKRRAFRPPKRPRRTYQRPSIPTPDLWQYRHGFGVALSRAACAVGFGMVPGMSNRFGDAALVVVCVLLGAAVAGAVFLLYRAGRALEWQLVADAMTLIVLLPALITASGIEVADARYGGRGENFLAAATALVLLFVVVTTVATRGWANLRTSGQTGSVPAAFSITIILLGTNHFSAGGMWRGLSIAWMVAAGVTLLATLAPARYRPYIVPGSFILVAVGVVMLNASGSSQSISSGASAVAALATAIVAAILIFVPLLPVQGGRTRPPE